MLRQLMLTTTRSAATKAETPAPAYSIAVYAAAGVIALIAAELRYVLLEQFALVSSEGQVAALGFVSFLILYAGLGILLAIAGRLPIWKAVVFGIAMPVLYIVFGGLLLALTNALARPTGGTSTRAFALAVIATTFLLLLGVAALLRSAPARRSWLTLVTLAVGALTAHIVFRLADSLISPNALGGAPAMVQRVLPPAVTDLLIAAFVLKLFQRTSVRRGHLPTDAVTSGASELVTAWPPKPEPAAAPEAVKPAAPPRPAASIATPPPKPDPPPR